MLGFLHVIHIESGVRFQGAPAAAPAARASPAD